MNNETWLPVAGYENLYEVSNLGRVRSLGFMTKRGWRKGRVLRPAKNPDGYLNVVLCKDGKQKTHKVHRLVATAHIPNPQGLPIINHRDENPSNNFVKNLEWCDYRYNRTYGSLADEIAERSREVYQYDLDGTFVAWYQSTQEAARQTGVSQGGIVNCASGKSNTQSGYQWRYEPALFLDATEGRFNNIQSKRVYQYTLDGRFIKEWPSTMEVERQTGWSSSAISACARGKHHHVYGFRWFYEYKGYSLK